MRKFGTLTEMIDGVELESKAIVPGLSLHDLVCIYDDTKAATPTEDDFSADPGKWPAVRGINAVVERVLEALEPRTLALEHDLDFYRTSYHRSMDVITSRTERDLKADRTIERLENMIRAARTVLEDPSV